MITNKFVNIDVIRNELIDKKFEIIDIEPKGQTIYLKDHKGKIYVLDTTADFVRVCTQKTDSEKLEELETKFNILLGMTNVDVEEVEELFQNTL